MDKIVGPGNIYVATAKRAVFGQVGIDMVAGPSEILILCDGGTDPDWIAMDLFSQAEHDEDAQSILVAWDAAFLDRVAAAIDRLLPTMERREIIAAALRARGALILARDLDEAIEVANHIAPEHLELSLADPEAVVGAHPPRRGHLHGPLHRRGPGRLLRRAQPRPAHLAHRALLLAAGGLRLPEALQPHHGLARRVPRTCPAPPRSWPAARG